MKWQITCSVFLVNVPPLLVEKLIGLENQRDLTAKQLGWATWGRPAFQVSELGVKRTVWGSSGLRSFSQAGQPNPRFGL